MRRLIFISYNFQSCFVFLNCFLSLSIFFYFFSKFSFFDINLPLIEFYVIAPLYFLYFPSLFSFSLSFMFSLYFPLLPLILSLFSFVTLILFYQLGEWIDSTGRGTDVRKAIIGK